jgi:hypothetical protein
VASGRTLLIDRRSSDTTGFFKEVAMNDPPDSSEAGIMAGMRTSAVKSGEKIATERLERAAPGE